MCFPIKGSSATIKIDTTSEAKKIDSVNVNLVAKTPGITPDKVSTSNTQKNAVWEGVKFDTKRDALIGAGVGLFGVGGVTLLGSKFLGAFSGKGAGLGLISPKALIITAGVGLVGGLALGAATGALEGAATGVIVKGSSKYAEVKGIDAKLHTQHVVGGLGALLGGSYAVKNSLQIVESISNPTVKYTAAAGLVAVSAASSYFAGSYLGGKIFDKSN
jgi:hypothetical protein